jgi:hypothetical protein
MSRFFNRYTAAAIAVQLIAIVQTWMVAVAISPTGDELFGLMFYFYFPPAYVAFDVLKLPIAAGFVGGAIHAFVIGVLVYAFIFGFVMSFWRQRK